MSCRVRFETKSKFGLDRMFVLLPWSPPPRRRTCQRDTTHDIYMLSESRFSYRINPKAFRVIDGIVLMYCYVFRDRSQQICLLDLAGGVERERIETKVFQLDCTTKLPVRTTHGDHMRLDLFKRSAFEVLHDGKRFLSKGCVRRSNNGRLRYESV